MVRKPTGDRAGDEDAGGERHHIQPGPQRGAFEAVSVQGQPDALQPNDEHELQSSPAEEEEETGDVPAGEGADAKKAKIHERLGDAGLHPEEDGQ